MPTKIKLPLSAEKRKEMIERLAVDYAEAEMDDSPREYLCDVIINGCKGLNDLTDQELADEYDDAYNTTIEFASLHNKARSEHG